MQLSANANANAIEFEIGICRLLDKRIELLMITTNQTSYFWQEAKQRVTKEGTGKLYLNHITSRGTPNQRLLSRLPCHTWSHTAVVRYVASGLDVKRRRNRRGILEIKPESKMNHTEVKHVPEGRSLCIQTRSAMDANERRSPRRCEKQA